MYTNYTDEELIMILMENPNDGEALETLVRRLRPCILGEAKGYRTKLPYDTDDYLQEGRIVIWKIAIKKNYTKKCFKNYYISAIRFHFRNLFRNYVLKNFVRIAGYEDCRGNTYSILIEDEFAKTYRMKHREECRKYNAKKKAQQEATQSRVPSCLA